MPLENLQSLIETLKERIAAHGTALRGSEALTRYVLIDPLLRGLGWDTADPAMVIPEYKSGNGRADYALLGNDGNPGMMVEAKSLGSSLRDAALSQGIQYCLEKGTKYFTLTDGNCWEIYETHRPVPIDAKRVVAFNLDRQPAAEVCLQALALWRPSLESGRAFTGRAPSFNRRQGRLPHQSRIRLLLSLCRPFKTSVHGSLCQNLDQNNALLHLSRSSSRTVRFAPSSFGIE